MVCSSFRAIRRLVCCLKESLGSILLSILLVNSWTFKVKDMSGDDADQYHQCEPGYFEGG